MNPWPTNPATIRAASRIGARPVRPSLFDRFRPALRRVGDFLATVAVIAATLILFAALYEGP